MDIEIIGILFMAVVAPVWIIAHYTTRWRTSRILSGEDQQLLAELWNSAERMEERIRNIENILDADQPDWRK